MWQNNFMARFPKVPGTGPKRIGNPVYWSRMVLQNERYKKTSRDAEELWNRRYETLWKYYDILWDDELAKVRDYFSQDEEDKLGTLNNEFSLINKEISEHPYLDNGLLNKLKTRTKNLILFVLKMCVKYEVFDDLQAINYDTKLKKFIINNDINNSIYNLW